MRQMQNEDFRKKMKTHCKHGHKRTKENTYITKNGCLNCKFCLRINTAKRVKESSLNKKSLLAVREILKG